MSALSFSKITHVESSCDITFSHARDESEGAWFERL
jgi:hypothetical protein